MPRRLLINEQPSFASIGYSHQQLSRVPRGTANRHSQFHCPKSKISKVWIALEEVKQYGLRSYLNLVLYLLLLNKFSFSNSNRSWNGRDHLLLGSWIFRRSGVAKWAKWIQWGKKSIRIMQFLGLIGLERCRSFGSPYPLIISGYGQANPELRRPQGR